MSAGEINVRRRYGEQVMSTIDMQSRPDPAAEDALALWLACHEQVRRFTRMTERLAEHLQRHAGEADAEADAEAVEAAQAIRRYFNQAAPLHHRDEIELFFHLAQVDASSAEQASMLLREHDLLAPLWQSLDRELAQIAQGHQLDLAAVSDFSSAYRRHVEAEEAWALPLFQRLPAELLQHLRTRMIQRRTCKT